MLLKLLLLKLNGIAEKLSGRRLKAASSFVIADR